jgi:CRISPR system Cascade subunit CasC
MGHRFIEMYVLQTVPPSNLNRDETGSPKSAVFGGVRRARVSSQAWKHATRKQFETFLDRSDLGVRTKRLVELIAAAISELAPDIEDTDQLAADVVQATGIKIAAPKTKKNAATDAAADAPQSQYLVFLSAHQIEGLAQLAVESRRSGSKINPRRAKEIAGENHGVEVALFGRMVADSVDLNVDAAVQVAHAISVHAVSNEFDYFTAGDDRAPQDNAGAGMMGTVEFNSSTLYRYATINLDGLAANLGDDAAVPRAVEAFMRAFITSMPTGKQNTFANRTLPAAVVIRLRDDQPVNLVGAFETAVEAQGSASRLAVASDRLAVHAKEIDDAFGDGGNVTFVVRTGEDTAALDMLGERVSLDAALARVRQEITTNPDPAR